MAQKIKGITVILLEKEEIEKDAFNRMQYEEVEEKVENVLVAPASSDDVISQLNLTGKKAVYSLGIPKGDTHNWVDRRVKFFGKTWKTIGIPQEGIEELIPLDWNKKIEVERYE
ncbi:MAG: hypothetical protein J5965_07260 [Aeriscardovia sp.]|nr:hypothetical protein [Aeriscardovia sp.]